MAQIGGRFVYSKDAERKYGFYQGAIDFEDPYYVELPEVGTEVLLDVYDTSKDDSWWVDDDPIWICLHNNLSDNYKMREGIKRMHMNKLFEDMGIDNKSIDHYSVEQVFEPLIKFGIDLNKNARKSGSYILTFDTMRLLVKLQDNHIIVCEPDYGYEQAIIKTTYGALYYCLKEYNSASFSRSSYRLNEVKKEITPDTKLYGVKMSEYIEQDDPFKYASKAKGGQLK